MGRKSKFKRGLLYRWAIGREIVLLLPGGNFTTGVLVAQKPYYVQVSFKSGRIEWFPKTYVHAVGAPPDKMNRGDE